MYSIVFFFSSRRRHTRCSRDWSSDVCSSDLELESHPVALAVMERNSIIFVEKKPAVCAGIDGDGERARDFFIDILFDGTERENRALADEKRSEEHTSELQSRLHLVCRLLLEKKKHA